jgi:hypothetical protein
MENLNAVESVKSLINQNQQQCAEAGELKQQALSVKRAARRLATHLRTASYQNTPDSRRMKRWTNRDPGDHFCVASNNSACKG